MNDVKRHQLVKWMNIRSQCVSTYASCWHM